MARPSLLSEQQGQFDSAYLWGLYGYDSSAQTPDSPPV